MNDEAQDLQELIERVSTLECTLKSFLDQESDVPVTLTANRLILRDSSGSERALLAAPDERSTALLLSDSTGTARLFIGLEEKGPTIALYDASETPRLKMTVSQPTNGSAFSLHDANGKTRVLISSIEGEPTRIALHDPQGEHRVDLFYVADANQSAGALMLKNSAGGRIAVTDTGFAILDPEGKTLFLAPQSEGEQSVDAPAQLLIYKNGQQHGPYPISQIKAWLASGEVSESDQAWYEGASGWISIASIPGL